MVLGSGCRIPGFRQLKGRKSEIEEETRKMAYWGVDSCDPANSIVNKTY